MSLRTTEIDDMTMHIGQSKVTPLETIGQAFMIKSQTVHDCRLNVVNVDRIFDSTEG